MYSKKHNKSKDEEIDFLLIGSLRNLNKEERIFLKILSDKRTKGSE